MSPPLWRGWMGPDKDFGDRAHNSFRAALQLSRGPRSHDSSLVQHSGGLRSAGEQITQVTAQLNNLFTVSPSAAREQIWQRWMGQGGAAASSSDAQPLAENNELVEGTAVASSDGQFSMAVQHWDARQATLEALTKAQPFLAVVPYRYQRTTEVAGRKQSSRGLILRKRHQIFSFVLRIDHSQCCVNSFLIFSHKFLLRSPLERGLVVCPGLHWGLLRWVAPWRAALVAELA